VQEFFQRADYSTLRPGVPIVPSLNVPQPVDFSTLSEVLVVDDEPEVLELLAEFFKTRASGSRQPDGGPPWRPSVIRRGRLIITDLRC
jgi:hypothetical protein